MIFETKWPRPRSLDRSAAQRREIAKFRVAMGLPPPKPGPKICLSCNNEFMSEDVKLNHICRPCSEIRVVLKKSSMV